MVELVSVLRILDNKFKVYANYPPFSIFFSTVSSGPV